MKCVLAVRIGLARPGNASPGLGIATFLKPNIFGSPAIALRNICRVEPGRNGPCITPRKACRVDFTPARATPRSRPYVPDQRLFLPTEQKKKDPEDAEQAPARPPPARAHNQLPHAPSDT